MTDQPFDAGFVFFRAGDPADRAFVLRSGAVDDVFHGGTREAALGAGDVFGEMALVDERPRRGTARAAAAGTVTAVTRAEFEAVLLADPAAAAPFVRAVFERLRVLADRYEPAAGPVGLPTGDPDAPPPAVRVVVYPLTRRAVRSLPDAGLLVTKFPLRIGRAPGANDPDGLDLNDVWLLDDKPYHVSRNHCAIDLSGGRAVVRDRGSHLGCLVNDAPVGGGSPHRSADLHPGQNVLVLGGPMSPYQFRVEVGDPADGT